MGDSFVWNNLQNDDISREQFARDLKTVLFARVYSSEAPLRTSAYKALYKWTLIYLLTDLMEVLQWGPGMEPWYGGLHPPEAEALFLTNHAIFNAPLMKIVIVITAQLPFFS